MEFQSLSVFALVAGCFVYAAWALLPQAARRALAKRLLCWPLPRPLRATMQKALSASAGCHCDGCDQAQAKPRPSGAQVLVFHPRKRR